LRHRKPGKEIAPQDGAALLISKHIDAHALGVHAVRGMERRSFSSQRFEIGGSLMRHMAGPLR